MAMSLGFQFDPFSNVTNPAKAMDEIIYEALDELLSPPLQKAVDDAQGDAKAMAQEALDGARDGWKKLSFAIARGVIGHITSNMEIHGIQTRGSVSATVQGNTGFADPGNHRHAVNLSSQASNVTFTQSNDGTGRVR
jgi:hypothetical protein